ncbi:MAG: transcriptional repressor LexA [Firmicutes bacterium]|nr:transcriptional repressor LexA [Bacillota bacterium]
MSDLSSRQTQIMEFIKQEIRKKGYPPSVREIGQAVGLRSSSTVHSHLNKLEEMGVIRRDPTKPRTIEVLDGVDAVRKDLINVPIVGRVAAGQPILATENIEDYFPLPKDFTSTGEAFILRVRGESMIEAGIFHGDYVVVQPQKTANNGEIVVALLEDDATVKRFFKEKDKIRLQPENSRMDPIYAESVTILGKVVGVIRKLH